MESLFLQVKDGKTTEAEKVENNTNTKKMKKKNRKISTGGRKYEDSYKKSLLQKDLISCILLFNLAYLMAYSRVENKRKRRQMCIYITALLILKLEFHMKSLLLLLDATYLAEVSWDDVVIFVCVDVNFDFAKKCTQSDFWHTRTYFKLFAVPFDWTQYNYTHYQPFISNSELQ